jgi:hypothetical protein
MTNKEKDLWVFDPKKQSNPWGIEGGPETLEKTMKDGKPILGIPPHSGLAQTKVPEQKYTFVRGTNDVLVGRDDGGAQIVFGRDRPASMAAGYGGEGAQNANAIDMVVGRGSSADLPDGSHVEPMFFSDAARIYVSQLTDIDINFGIVGGAAGTMESRSSIGMMADGVRMFGKEGVKIVTGNSFAFGKGGTVNSLGLKIADPAPPIELIAGNNDSVRSVVDPVRGGTWKVKTLQGVAMGENVRDCIDELADLLSNLMGITYNLAILQTVYTGINSVDQFRPWVAGQGPLTTNEYLGKIISSLHMMRINKEAWAINYTDPYGAKYIPSRNVFST